MSEEGVPALPEEIEAKISQLKDKRGSLREERAYACRISSRHEGLSIRIREKSSSGGSISINFMKGKKQQIPQRKNGMR